MKQKIFKSKSKIRNKKIPNLWAEDRSAMKYLPFRTNRKAYRDEREWIEDFFLEVPKDPKTDPGARSDVSGDFARVG